MATLSFTRQDKESTIVFTVFVKASCFSPPMTGTDHHTSSVCLRERDNMTTFLEIVLAACWVFLLTLIYDITN